MKTRRKLRRGRHTKRKRRASRAMNTTRIKKHRIHKRWKGGEEHKLIFLEGDEINILNEIFNFGLLSKINGEFNPTTTFEYDFIKVLKGEKTINEDNRNKIFYQLRSYLLSALYLLKQSNPPPNDILKTQQYIQFIERLVQRIDMYSPTVELFEVLGRWKRWLFSQDIPQLYSFPADTEGRSGVGVSMDVYPDLSNPEMIGKSVEDINRNPSKILDFKYRIYGDNPVKNAEHALNLIFFSPYLLETQGEDYVDFLTRPITSQHGEVLYYNSTQGSDNNSIQGSDNNSTYQSPLDFSRHKYLKITNQNQFAEVKRKYVNLAKHFDTDNVDVTLTSKCPNNTNLKSKEECKQEFQILNDEYENIKNALDK